MRIIKHRDYQNPLPNLVSVVLQTTVLIATLITHAKEHSSISLLETGKYRTHR